MILGHKAQLTLLEKILALRKNNYAFLFSGPEKIGKKTVALYLFEKILQKNPFYHPDFLFLKPDEKNKISIDTIKELISFLSFSSFHSFYKCVLIDNAHTMTREAQQSFLKTLEEPRGKTIIILISHLPEMLLTTLRSRLQQIVFFTPSLKEIEDFLANKKIDRDSLEKILKFSFLQPSLIFQFLENKEKITWVQERINEFSMIIKEPLFKRFSFAKEITKRKDFLEIVNLWILYLRHLFILEVKKEGNPLNLTKIKKILEELQDLIFLLSFGKINKQLAIENFLIKI